MQAFSSVRRASIMSHAPLFQNVAVLERLEKDFNNPEAAQMYGHELPREQFQRILAQLRVPPVYTTVRVNTMVTTAEQVRVELSNHLPEYFVTIHTALPDAIVIAPSSKRHQDELLPESKEIIVDLKCGMSVLRGANINTPGIIGAPAGMRQGDRVSVFVDIDHKCLKGRVKSFNGRKVFVGNGISMFSRSEIFVTKTASGVAVKMTDQFCQCPSLGDFIPKQLFLQNLPSIVCGHVVGPTPGQTVLDMCAAPGGKTTHLAMLMKNQGTVVALDKSQPKVDRITANANRFGLTCVRAFVFDATKSWNPTVPPWTGHTVLEPPFPSETFDHILLDAPCSALGQRPQLCNKMTLKELDSHHKLQRKLLSNAVHLVKTNGTLVYSTCTFTMTENECMVKWVQDNFPQLCLVKQDHHFGYGGWPGADLRKEDLALVRRFGTHWTRSGSNLVVDDAHHALQQVRLDDADSDTIGFFIAKFVKQRLTDSLRESRTTPEQD